MPKMIADLEESLVETAREILLTDGYQALTMRSIAARCGVAVGTAYNYVSGKEQLVARVMLKDWRDALARMMQLSLTAGDIFTAVEKVFEQIDGFWQGYAHVFQEYGHSGRAAAMQSSYHQLRIRQVTEVIAPALEKHGCLYTPALPAFLAETLLSAAAGGRARYEQLLPIFKRILKP